MQSRFNDRRFGWSVLVTGWLMVMLACNLPLSDAPPPLLPPTRPAQQPTVDVAAPTSPPAGAATLAVPTPAVATPGATATGSFAPAATATPRTTPDPNAPTPTYAPLQLSYTLEWVLDTTNPNFALATVRLRAIGGDGNYTFYRDDIPTGGSDFVYRWGACRANPGSFRVESGDGQTARLNYFEQPPCPQP